jgi:hypothetical protein
MVNNVKTPLTVPILKKIGFSYDGTTRSYTHPEECIHVKFEDAAWQLYYKRQRLRSIDYLDTLIDAFRLLGTGWSLLACQLQDMGYS